jgi:tol-pal system protein YbgF
MKSFRIIFLLITFLLPCCTQRLQQQIDTQKQAIDLLQKKTDRSLADYHNELDKIRREIQSVKGFIEENSYRTEKGISKLKVKMNHMLASLEEKQTQIELLQKQFGSVKPEGKKIQGLPSASLSKEQELYNQAYSHYENREFIKARELFEKFLKAYPSSTLTDNALYWAGNCYFKEKKFERAISTFDDVIKKFPQGNKVPDSYYLQALAFCEINEPLTAQIILETLIQNFPSSKAASMAKKKHEELKKKTAP